MLRNSVQSALCGLIIPCVVACSSTHPLLSDKISQRGKAEVKIKATPYVEYRFLGALRPMLDKYIPDGERYLITIEITEQSSSAVYTAKEVVKDQMRMIAKVDVYDGEHNSIGTKLLDTYTTYEVSDELPSSGISSKQNAMNSVIDELACSSVLAIRAILGKKLDNI